MKRDNSENEFFLAFRRIISIMLLAVALNAAPIFVFSIAQPVPIVQFAALVPVQRKRLKPYAPFAV